MPAGLTTYTLADDGGTVITEQGGANLANALPVTPVSITTPWTGHRTSYWDGDAWDGYYDDYAERLWFQFTPDHDGRLYLGAWPSYQGDVDGNRLDRLPATVEIAEARGAWYDDMEWTRFPNHGYFEVTGATTYAILVAVDWTNPDFVSHPNFAQPYLSLLLSQVHAWTPWQADPVLPTVLLDGTPLPSPGAPTNPGLPEDDPDEPEYEEVFGTPARFHAHFVGRT